MVFLAHRLHSGLYSSGTFPVRPSFVTLLKNCTLYHLTLLTLLPCFIFPLTLITSVTRYCNYLSCLLSAPCLLVVLFNLFFLSSWAPGFSARNYIFLSPLWLGSTIWLKFRQRYVYNSDVCHFPKEACPWPLLSSSWLELENQMVRKAELPTSLGP